MNGDERIILKKGLNFAVAPRKIPLEEIICAIEDAVTTLPENEANEVRQDCAVILRRATPPKHNINKNEAAALKNMKTNNKIMIMKADKGNATVVMDTHDYLSKMEEHLTKGGSYTKLKKYPSTKIIKEVKKAIDDSTLDEDLKRKLMPKNTIIPRIYGLPKIHK